jgi:hypothetical protein
MADDLRRAARQVQALDVPVYSPPEIRPPDT